MAATNFATPPLTNLLGYHGKSDTFTWGDARTLVDNINTFLNSGTFPIPGNLVVTGSITAGTAGFITTGTTSGNVTLKSSTGTYTLTLPTSAGSNGQVLSTNGSGVLSWISNAATQWTTTGSDIYYSTGYVGIGATPTQLLDIGQAISAPTPMQRIRDTVNSRGDWSLGLNANKAFYVYPNSTDGTSAIFVIQDVTATKFFFYNTDSGVLRMTGYGAGTAVFDSSGNITSVSDIRLKDVTGEFTYGLGAVKQINPIIYHWNEESGLNQDDVNIGFSAQEIEKIIPEAVSKQPDTLDEEGNIIKEGYKTFSDRPIIAALVNAVKELSDKVDALKK